MHIITGLGGGGAESVLYRLCKNDLDNNKHVVVSMMGEGKYGPLLKEIGIDVYTLDMSVGKISISGLIKLYCLIRRISPDIVQTWMYHADLIGGIIARLAGIKKIFWNIRHTTLEKGVSKKSTIMIAKLCAKLSGIIPYKIICCASSALDVHADLGYKEDKLVIIKNGYELNKFTPDSEKGMVLRQSFSIEDKIVLGMVGRYSPLKDHNNLLQSIDIVGKQTSDFVCLLVGNGLTNQNEELVEKIRQLDLSDHILLLGQRNDIPEVMNALDLHILSSMSEGFPNVLAEAMACGTPCITTDVGDASVIVGETGWIVPPKNPEALADAILVAVEARKDFELWQVRKNACREHIVSNFSIESMVENYNKVWFYEVI